MLAGGCGASLPALTCGSHEAAASTACEAQGVEAGRDSARNSPEEAASNGAAQPPSSAAVPLLFGADDLTPTLKSKLSGLETGETMSRAQHTGPLTLAEAVRSAIRSSAQKGIAAAARFETEAAVNAARAAYRPTLDVNATTGQNTYGTLITTAKSNYFDPGNITGAWRNDLRLSGTMMLYDFGAVEADVSRAMSARDAAALREAAAAEEAAFTAVQLYVKLLQSRELMALAEENLAALKAIANLIQTNVQNGNATQADIQRVNARVLDAEAARTDQQLELRVTTERFIRTVNVQPGELRPTPGLEGSLPSSVEKALDEALKRNPIVVANAAVVAAARAEAAALKLSERPRLSVDTSAQSKTYRGQGNKTELDLTAMLSLSYRIADGGLSSAKYEQASARLTQAQLRDLDTRETLETDLRQQFLQLASAKTKREGLLMGVKASAKARELYNEQFIGGKRTLLELLETQNAYYNARFNSIINGSDVRLATFAILRSTGRLSATILGQS